MTPSSPAPQNPAATPSTSTTPSQNALLATCLLSTAEELPRGPEKRALVKLAEALQQGQSLEALIALDQNIPSDLKVVIQSGLSHGALPQLLQDYLESIRETGAIWSSFYCKLLYPMTLIPLAVAVNCFFYWIAGDALFSLDDHWNFGELVSWGSLGRLFAPYSFAAGVLALLAAALLIAIPWSAAWRARNRFVSALVHLVPIAGSAWRYASAAEFCSRLAVLVDAHVPLTEAAKILSQTLTDARMREASAVLEWKLNSGKTPEELAQGVAGLLPEQSSVFRWADAPGPFAESLRMQAQILRSQATVRSSQFGFLVLPVALSAAALIGAILPSMSIIASMDALKKLS